MFNKIFSWFENRLNPYPKSNPTTPEKGLFRFIWSSIDGMKGWIFLLVGIDGRYWCNGSLTFPIYGVIGGLAGCLFTNHTLARKGHLACWHGSLAHFQYCMVIRGRECTLTNATRGISNAFALEFPPFDARPSLSFYQDEFAGRVSAKVMQTALAVRDTVMTIADMLVYVAVYFITSSLVLAALDTWF